MPLHGGIRTEKASEMVIQFQMNLEEGLCEIILHTKTSLKVTTSCNL